MTTLVLGYYDHGNLGDEQYKHSLPWLLGRDCRFVNSDTLIEGEERFEDGPWDLIVIGGGNLLSGYFLEPIGMWLQMWTRPLPPIVGVSLGVTDFSSIDTDAFRAIPWRTVHVRSFQDDLSRLTTVPIQQSLDAAFLWRNRITVPVPVTAGRLGVCLNAHVLKDPLRCAMLGAMLATVAASELRVYVFSTEDKHDDAAAAQRVLGSGYDMVQPAQPYGQIVEDMASCESLFVMRYHGCIAAILSGRPFHVASGARKVWLLARDLQFDDAPHYTAGAVPEGDVVFGRPGRHWTEAEIEFNLPPSSSTG